MMSTLCLKHKKIGGGQMNVKEVGMWKWPFKTTNISDSIPSKFHFTKNNNS